jgi:hypothetical protein
MMAMSEIREVYEVLELKRILLPMFNQLRDFITFPWETKLEESCHKTESSGIKLNPLDVDIMIDSKDKGIQRTKMTLSEGILKCIAYLHICFSVINNIRLLYFVLGSLIT